MYTIASLLPQDANQLLENLWNSLQDECSTALVTPAPFPHISWQIAGNYLLNNTKIVIADFCEQYRPFEIHSKGLGLFTGVSPILYCPVVKNFNVYSIHQTIWSRLDGLCQDINPNYHIDNWIPHISLSYGDLTPQNLTCAISRLLLNEFEIHSFVDNISILFRNEDTFSVIDQFNFSKPVE